MNDDLSSSACCALGVLGFADRGVFGELVDLHDRQRHLRQLLALGVRQRKRELLVPPDLFISTCRELTLPAQRERNSGNMLDRI